MTPRARRVTSRGRAAPVAFVLVAVLGIAACTPRGPSASYPATEVSTLTVTSTALARDMPVRIFRPRGFDPSQPFRLLYLFHGFGADEGSWFGGHDGDGVHADGMAQGLLDSGRICPTVIASAFIANSYGVDSKPASDQFAHGPFAQYLANELLRAVEASVGFHGGTRQRFVAGLSMGGFAALHLALTHPGAFAGVGALSPAAFVSTPADRQWLFDGDPAANDPMLLLRGADIGGLAFFIGYGTSDYGWVRDGAAELAARLSARGVAVTPVVVPGGHDVGTWRQLAPRMLEALLSAPCASA